jgi:hypothetical protein
MLLVASADACLSLPSTSTWEGHWTSTSGHSGTWSASVSAVETSPGQWTVGGSGMVTINGFGSASGHLQGLLNCTSSTTDGISGTWEDGFGDKVNTMGELSINASAAVEKGTWSGPTIGSPSDSGAWQGEFRPTAGSGGGVMGTVEVESSPGTLINSLQITAANELPLLPSGDVAPVGGVTFAANVATGATIKVKLTLPPGSHPTALFKLVSGMYVEVPSTIVGETVEYEITDGGTFDEDGVANGEVVDPVVPVGHSLEVATTKLPAATRGAAYSAQLAGAGGKAPYSWKKLGKLPKGLKLTKSGVIQGTPSAKLAPGTYPVRVVVKDATKQTATSTLMLKIN